MSALFYVSSSTPTMKDSSQGYALFDLDQTLIPWDTQLLFCNWMLQRYPMRRLLMAVFVLFLPLAKVLGAGGMKRVFLIYLCGLRADELEKEVEPFVEWLLENHTYPDMVERLKAETKSGKFVVLTSASPEIYVKEIGRRLGVDAAYGTKFSLGDPVRVFPDLDYENNKGEAKVRRMMAEGVIPSQIPLPHSIAYSDSKADLPILKLCEKGVLVNPSEALRKQGEDEGWELCQPARPTTGKLFFGLACARQMFGLFSLKS